MRTLITGALGFIGSHLYALLPEAKGWDVKDAWNQDIRTNLPQESFTHIFHLAAKRSVPLGEQEPFQFISTNCWGTLNILRTYPNARILNISSSAAAQAKSVYGATKKFAECVGYQHPNCLNVRLYNVFGERQEVESGAVVPHFITSKLTKKPVTIYGEGWQTRDFTYVGDVVLELKRLMFETEEVGLVHVGYHAPVSVQDLLSLNLF